MDWMEGFETMMTNEQLDIICDRAKAGCVYWDDSIRLVNEIKRLRAELETERMRLAACGVAAMCNTETSIKQQFDGMKEEYSSASLRDVQEMVKREMDLRSERDSLRAKLDELKRLGTDLCTEATPWADVGSRIDCATNRECLRHAITEFLSVGYDGIVPDENECPLPIAATEEAK